MRYSVVIPMYNSSATIHKTIESVINQTRYDLVEEIIIVNDGSTDNSTEIVKGLLANNKKIRLLNKKNGGAASARNVGIKATKNNMVALLDADDEWLPEKIEIQDKVFESHKEIKALGSNRVGESIRLGTLVHPGVRKISPIDYCIKCWPCTPSLIFDKSLFGNALWFPEDMTHAEEGLFFLKLAHGAGLFYSMDELVLCGGGKRAFGASGLSGNIELMHKGVLLMINRAGAERIINPVFVPILKLLEEIKYIRRKLVAGKSNG